MDSKGVHAGGGGDTEYRVDNVPILDPRLECDVQLSLVSNVWIKQLDFKEKDMVMVSHQHSFDHQTLLAHGSLRVFVDEQHVKDFHAPSIIVIRAGQNHVLHALEDHTVAYCIHAVRTGERVEDIVDPSQEIVSDESDFVRKE